MGSTRVPGLSVDIRKQRLREVATLSEAKLRDSDAAISAFRGVVTLDPGDREAVASLKRLLKKAQQWDELASVLEREALATTGVDDKAALIREIALIAPRQAQGPGRDGGGVPPAARAQARRPRGAGRALRPRDRARGLAGGGAAAARTHRGEQRRDRQVEAREPAASRSCTRSCTTTKARRAVQGHPRAAPE